VDKSIAFKFEAARGLSIGITSYAVDQGKEFPFVTLPDYELRAAQLLSTFQADGVYWSPLVSDEQRDTWESYTVVEAPKWILESVLAAGLETVPNGGSFKPFIHNASPVPVEGPVFTGNEILSGMYSPGW
jgi:hypothetical protein